MILKGDFVGALRVLFENALKAIGIPPGPVMNLYRYGPQSALWRKKS